MKVLFKSLMGSFPKRRRTEIDVLATGVSIKKGGHSFLINVNNLHIRIDVLSKVLAYYDMKDVFRIYPEQTVQRLNTCLDVLFVYQTL